MPNSDDRLVDRFLKLEHENNCLEASIDGVYFWCFLRFEIFTEITKRIDSLGKSHTKMKSKQIVSSFGTFFRFVRNCIWFNPFLRLKKRPILVLNHPRRVFNEGFYECIYTDSIIQSFNLPYVIIEEMYLFQHYRPVRYSEIKYTDFLWVLNKIARLPRKSMKEEGANLVADIIGMINTEFDIEFDKDYWIRKTQDLIISYRLFYRCYEHIMNRVQPRVILQVTSYSLSRYIINEIAKKQGIPTIELQHGTMGKDHIAYNYYQKTNLPYFPEYVFLFGEYWKKNTRFPIDDSRVIVTGWPYYEKKLKNNSLNRSHADQRKTIVFISQGTIGSGLSKFAVELSLMISKEAYRIIYKLHPGEYDRWEQEYPCLVDSGLDIVDNNKHDIHYFFSCADIQIGVNSTTLFEGMGYSLDTFIVALPGYDTMKDLYTQGYATLVSTPSEFVEKLDTDRPVFSSELFWKFGSQEEIKHQINKICECNLV